LRDALPIHDLFIRRIPAERDGSEQRWIALQDGDHLLRRFGLAEVVRVEADLQPAMRLREAADEVWALIEGKVEFRWHDHRSDSPTSGVEHRIVCDTSTLVLSPFGVAFGFRPLGGPALLLRLATHAEGSHDGDRRLSWEKLT